MSNINAATQDYVERWARLLDEIGDKQEELKDLKADAKDDGFNLKAMAQLVKEKRKGAEYMVDQLTLELEVTTYRKAVGHPTELEEAQRLAREEAGTDPDERFGGDDAGDGADADDVVSFEAPKRGKGKRGAQLKPGVEQMIADAVRSVTGAVEGKLLDAAGMTLSVKNDLPSEPPPLASMLEAMTLADELRDSFNGADEIMVAEDIAEKLSQAVAEAPLSAGLRFDAAAHGQARRRRGAAAR